VTDLQQGRDYHVLLSTGNGFRRYRLGDRVRVSGFIHATPCLDFIGRDSSVSDVVGEKLHVAEAERALAECEREMGLSLAFALLAPEREGRQWRYVLHCEGLETGAPVASETLAVRLDETLSDNFHYRHARNLGQLGPLVVHCIRDGVVKYRDRVTVKGARIGQVKLGLLHSETDWRAALS